MVFTPQGGDAGLSKIELYREPSSMHDGARVRVSSSYVPTLSDLLPLFTAFGLEVIDERTAEIETSEKTTYEIDLGIRTRGATLWSEATTDQHQLDNKLSLIHI